MTPELRPIPECPGYSASADGRIFSHRRRKGAPRELRQFDRKTLNGYASPYLSVSATRNGKPCNRFVHELVLIAWVGPRPGTTEEVEACHGLGGSRDNRVSNLRWDSVEANTRDRQRHRMACYGGGYAELETCEPGPDVQRAYFDEGHAFSDMVAE